MLVIRVSGGGGQSLGWSARRQSGCRVQWSRSRELALPGKWLHQIGAGVLGLAPAADAWIAAAALISRATLVHKDPEFEAITQLDQVWLA